MFKQNLNFYSLLRWKTLLKIIISDFYKPLKHQTLPLKFFSLSDAVMIKKKENADPSRAIIFHRQELADEILVYEVDFSRFLLVEKSEIYSLR